MSGKLHRVHKIVADQIERVLPLGSLVKDEACGGDQRIPLFCNARKSRETEYCNVDLLVMKKNRIKVIVEIEESDVKPTQICGKFLTSALAKYYIHDSRSNEPVEMDESVAFIQIVDTSKLVKDKSAKISQWKALAKSIEGVIPLRNSRITSYNLLTTDELDKLGPIMKQLA